MPPRLWSIVQISKPFSSPRISRDCCRPSRDAPPLLDAAQSELVANASADRLTWVAFPKAGQLDTDLNRDRVAEALIAAGIRPVRNVSIDDVWSALRFRPGG